MRKVAVTGGRYHDNPEFVRSVLDEEYAQEPFVLLVGDARGADAAAKQWAIDNKVNYILFKAEWNKYGKSAGPVRNGEMLTHADKLLAFRGGKGTQNAVYIAGRRNIPVEIHNEH